MKTREQLAEEYLNGNECEVMDTFSAHLQTYFAGFDAAAERAKGLVEALEYTVSNSCSYCGECAACGSQHKPISKEALAEFGGGK